MRRARRARAHFAIVARFRRKASRHAAVRAAIRPRGATLASGKVLGSLLKAVYAMRLE